MTSEVGSIYGPRVRTTRPRIDFWVGIAGRNLPWETMWEMLQQRQRWTKFHYGAAAFEDKPLYEGYTSFDYSDGGKPLATLKQLLHPKDLVRLEFLLNQQEEEHDEHHFLRLRPFCPKCRPSREIARLSLCSRLVLRPNREIPERSDTELGWDTEQVPVTVAGKESKKYKSMTEMEQRKPPKDLIEGIIPRRGVGYITGRDRSLKTFLALDISLHVAFMSEWWHAAPDQHEAFTYDRRSCNWRRYGRALFAAGEGSYAFPQRIRAWIQAQHIRGWEGGEFGTPDGASSVRFDDCPTCQNLEDPLIGHVNHLEFKDPENPTLDFWMKPGMSQQEEDNLTVREGTPNFFAGGDDYRYMLALARERRPDVIVLDTLALSAGSADQQSAVDMGIIHERAKQMEMASQGVVIIIAHTDKGDNDARGSSVIEDNSDFVLHCNRKDNDQLEVTVAKRKDAPDNWSFTMAVEQVELGLGQSSLILKDWDPTVHGAKEEEPIDDLQALIDFAVHLVTDRMVNFFTKAELLDVWDKHPSDRTVRRLLMKCVDNQVLWRTGRDTGGGHTPVQYHLMDSHLEQLSQSGVDVVPFDPDNS